MPAQRAHRIGQTRPVTGQLVRFQEYEYSLLRYFLVKTLVIRSTAEEAMIARRQYLRNSDKLPKNMTTESGMRQYLEVSRVVLMQF